jgi:uncharacterized protein (TIGR02678 family)
MFSHPIGYIAARLETPAMFPDTDVPATAQALLQRAHRYLLNEVVLARDMHPEEYRLVRRYAAALGAWHESHTGWTLYTGPQTIRLLRRPATVPSGIWDPWRAAVSFQSPRDYACLAL